MARRGLQFLAAGILLVVVLAAGRPALAQTPSAAGFLERPVYNAEGVAFAIFHGTSVEQLAQSAQQAGAWDVWVQDAGGTYRRLEVNNPVAQLAFKEHFPQNFRGLTSVTLTQPRRRQPQVCERWNAAGSVTITPAAPRGGERVLLAVEQLPPGPYAFIVTWSREGGTWSEEFAVGADGRGQAEFFMPHEGQFSVARCYHVIVRGPTPGSVFVEGPPFIYTGTDLRPAPCGALPDTLSQRGRLIGYPAAAGSTHDWMITGEGLQQARSSSRVRAGIVLAFSDQERLETVTVDGDLQLAPDYPVAFRFALPPKPEWSGRCVHMYVRSASPDSFWPFGHVRFNYP